VSRLGNTRALVTGSSRGIGRAITERYLAEGASVALLARSVDRLETITEGTDGRAIAIECDVRETADVDRAVERAVTAFGGLDVVVNNAGVFVRSPIGELDDDAMEWVVDVNLKGYLRVARATIPVLEDGGTLINVSSQLASAGVPDASAYCATKGAIDNLTRQLAVECAEDGVRVNGLAPGVVDTEMTPDDDVEWEAEKRRNIPLNRIATPKEIAGPAVFLASSDASYLTGHVLVVDGGYLAR